MTIMLNREKMITIAIGLAVFVIVVSLGMAYILEPPPSYRKKIAFTDGAPQESKIARLHPFCPYVAEVMNDVPIAIFRFQEGSSSPDAVDAVANRKAMMGSSTEIGGPAAVDCGGSASLRLRGKGSAAHVRFDRNINAPTFTIEMWAKHSKGSGDVISSGDLQNNGYLVSVVETEKGPTWQASCGGLGGEEKIAVGPKVSKTWEHLAATYDGHNLRFFVNGKMHGETPAKCKPSNSGPTTIGGGDHGGVEADVGELAMYAHAVGGESFQKRLLHARKSEIHHHPA